MYLYLSIFMTYHADCTYRFMYIASVLTCMMFLNKLHGVNFMCMYMYIYLSIHIYIYICISKFHSPYIQIPFIYDICQYVDTPSIETIFKPAFLPMHLFQGRETLGILPAIAWIWFSTRKFWGEDGGAHTSLQAFAL